MNPKVSIIVPVYNVERYLDRCVKSLLGQTLKDVEIILVDDKSPDGCPAMCDHYASQHDRIKVVHKSINEGLGKARNTGLDVATGEYVMFVDSDDRIELNSCEYFYHLSIQYMADIATGNFVKETECGTWVKDSPFQDVQALDKEAIREYIKDMLGCAPYAKQERLYPVSSCLLFIRRRLLEDKNIRFRSEREVSSEDTLFKTELLLMSEIMVCTPFCFYYYYVNCSSLTHTFKYENWDRLVVLRSCLLRMIGEDETYRLRINRFISSEYRAHISSLIGSSYDDKLTCVRESLQSPVWIELAEFKPSYYPFYANIFHWLCVHNHPFLLLVYVRVIIPIKKLLSK
ncbi:glycosyltransferase family 2 protein [Prevotella sp. RM4]|uniref:glycosyltransferase family 2 protein n=1 Tax=Prevotella sp. RM4 TaxID=1200547 RepID=UPI000690A001|nr:glycosyltransferase family 2 protein [Prevotella sp. RM4]